MNRRRFLRESIFGGAAALGTGAFLFGRRSFARSEATSRMLEGALPSLAANSLRELQTLPVRAHEEIKRYFHGKCLNVEGFVSHICGDDFGQQLGSCTTDEQREVCFLHAFAARVATEAEICNRIDVIHEEVGGELNATWHAYCSELSGKWKGSLQQMGKPIASDELSHRLGEKIQRELVQAAKEIALVHRVPSFGATIDDICADAVKLMPMANVAVTGGPQGVGVKGNVLVLPVFFLRSCRHLWGFFTTSLAARRGDYQAAMSGRLARLGNQVGAEFYDEVHLRLANLHTWQDRSVRQTAGRLVEERIGLI